MQENFLHTVFIPNTCSGRIHDVVFILHAWQVHAWQVHVWQVHAWQVHAWQVHAWQVHAEAHTILSAQVLLLHLSKPVLAVTLHTSSEHSQGLTKNSFKRKSILHLFACMSRCLPPIETLYTSLPTECYRAH